MSRHGHSLLRFYLKIFLFHLVVLTGFRAVIYFLFRGLQGSLESGAVAQAFKVGLFFDLRMAAMVSLLFTLLLLVFVTLNRRRSRRAFALVLTGSVTVWGVVMASVLAIDIANFSYLNEHLNGAALRYFSNPVASFGMVIDSYPIAILVPLVIVGAAVLFWCARRFLVAPALAGSSEKGLPWLTALGLAVLSAVCIYGKLSHYPLRWSDAFFSSNTFVSQLGLNPFLYFFDTLKNRTIDYEIASSEAYADPMAAHLGLTDESRASLDFSRPNAVVPISELYPQISDPEDSGIKNVVIIVVESLGAFKIGALGHPLDATPCIDELLAESYTFPNHYSSVAGTARGLFSLVTGLPDVARVETSSRNPLVINQHVVFDQLPQPEKSFWIGGSANWGNIRALFGENIDGIDIVEEGEFEAERNDVWGVSDLDLFKALNESLEAKTEPFVAVALTSGYHRPYTIPAGRGDFEIMEVEPDVVRNSGFSSTKEFHSFRFADYTLGKFFEMAKASSYYDETLFVVTGDHGLTNRGAHHLSEAEKNLNLERVHVPLIFHAPALISGATIDPRPNHHMDIFPTIAHLLGAPCDNRTLGRSVFCPLQKGKDGAFLMLSANRPYHIGWLEEGWFLSYKETGVSRLYAYPSEDDNEAPQLSPELVARKARMEELAKAHFEVTRYLLYNNRKDVRDGG